MPITLKGARVEQFSVEREDSMEAKYKITARYALISSEDKVLAKQTVGGYGGMTVEPTVDTEKALQTFLKAYSNDIGKALGLDVE